jgi:predicted amidohydrolase
MFRISLVQFTPKFGAPAANRTEIASILQKIKTDLIILPELCTTGYSFISRAEAMAAAEEPDGEDACFFTKMAKDKKAMVVAGFAEKNGEKVYNSALVAFPDGTINIYRKSHLFFREKVCFDPGDTGFFVVRHPLKDCEIGVMVCNDWRYPEAARSLALLGADVIACPANLVSKTWQVAMPARALENKLYLAVANRAGTEVRRLPDGTEQKLLFNGSSVLYAPDGQFLAQASKTENEVITLQIDPALARDKSFNEFNNIFKDRRTDLYIG